MPRTRYDKPMQEVLVRLTEEHRRIADELGDGVMAEGVRRALEQAKDQTNEE